MAVGMTGKPPAAKKTQPNKGQGVGMTAKPPKVQKGKPAQYDGLNKKQGAAINQTNKGDVQLAKTANAQLPQIQQNFNQPFDFGSLPQAPNGIDYSNVYGGPQGPVDYSPLGQIPGSGNFQQYQQDALNAMTGAFDSRFKDVFKQQEADFEQSMANKGIPMGSKQYNQLKTQMQQSQNDAISQNLAQSYGLAGSQAAQLAGVGQSAWNLGAGALNSQFDQGMNVHNTQMGDVGTQYMMGQQAYQDAYGNQMQQRYQPLADFNALRAGMSSMPTQNLGYSQQRGLNQQQGDIALYNAQHAPRGGGGGGAGAEWQQMGFANPMDYYAWKVGQDRENKLWDYANNPAYKQQGPSTTSQIAGGIGGILGSALQGWGASGFKKFW